MAEAIKFDLPTGLDAPAASASAERSAGSKRLGRAQGAPAAGSVVEMGAAARGMVIVDDDGGGASTSWPCVVHSECLRAADEVPAFRDLQEWAAANMPDELAREALVDTMLRVIGEPVDDHD